MSPWLAVAFLFLPGVIPAVAVAGLSPAAIFLIPLIGALAAAFAATLEFLISGTAGAWFVVVALAINVVAGALLVRRVGDGRFHRPSRWEVVRAIVLIAAVGWPLVALTAPVIGYDTEAIWLIHAAMFSGGHREVVAALTDTAAQPTNPDYPPLVPGAAAVAYAMRGSVDQFLAVRMVALLNAGAVGLCAEGLLRLVPERSSKGLKLAGLLVGVGFAGAIYGLAGVYAVNGYADVLWASAAAAGMIFGLVLPCRGINFAVAAACIEVATMTKNEGLVIGLGMATLVMLRYWWSSGHRPVTAWRWLAAGAATVGGGLLWAGAIRVQGLGDAFFATPSGESAAERLRLTAAGMWAQLHLLPVAAAVALVGQQWLRGRKDRDFWSMPAGASIRVWVITAWALAAFTATYVFGSLEIRWWLFTSVQRTMIFVNVCLLVDMVGWGLRALAVALPPTPHGPIRTRASTGPEFIAMAPSPH